MENITQDLILQVHVEFGSKCPQQEPALLPHPWDNSCTIPGAGTPIPHAGDTNGVVTSCFGRGLSPSWTPKEGEAVLSAGGDPKEGAPGASLSSGEALPL